VLPENEAGVKLGTSVPILLKLDETGIASRERYNPVEDDFQDRRDKQKGTKSMIAVQKSVLALAIGAALLMPACT